MWSIQRLWPSVLCSSSWRQLSTEFWHTHRPLCGTDHLFMCFSAQTIRPPDRKSPSGHATAVLPKPYVTHSYKIKQLPEYVSMCCVFGACSLWCVGFLFVLWFQFAYLSSNTVSVCFWGCCFVSVLHFARFFNFVSIVYALSMTSLFPSHWNVPDYKRCESVSELKLRSGLWLVRDGASATHPVSAPCMARLDDSLPPWLFP